jgi:hypothetical protein
MYSLRMIASRALLSCSAVAHGVRSCRCSCQEDFRQRPREVSCDNVPSCCVRLADRQMFADDRNESKGQERLATTARQKTIVVDVE